MVVAIACDSKSVFQDVFDLSRHLLVPGGKTGTIAVVQEPAWVPKASEHSSSVWCSLPPFSLFSGRTNFSSSGIDKKCSKDIKEVCLNRKERYICTLDTYLFGKDTVNIRFETCSYAKNARVSNG